MQTSTIPIPTYPDGVAVALGEPKRGHAPFRVTVRNPDHIGDDGKTVPGNVEELCAGRVRVADVHILVDRGGSLDPAVADHLRASVGGAS